MEAVLFKTFTKIPLLMFRTIGVQPFQMSTTNGAGGGGSSTKLWLIFFLSHINLGLLVLGEMIYFVRNFGKFSSFVELTSVTLCIGFIWLSLTKVASIVWNRDHTNAVIAELNEMFPQNITVQNDYKAPAYASLTKRIMIGYSALQMVMIWLFNLVPFSDAIIQYSRDGTWNVDFPYIIWYPFDPYPSGWFEVNFLLQMWAGYVAAAGILASDLLLCSIVLQICMHFDRLHLTLLEMEPPTSVSNRFHIIRSDKRADKRMLSIEQSIKVHNQIIKYRFFVGQI